MKEIIVRVDDAPDLRFTGQLIARVDDRSHEGPRNTRWTELRLWRTKSGTHVAGRLDRTQWIGERDRYAAVHGGLPSTVTEFLGFGWLAKNLYAASGLDVYQDLV